MPYNGTGTFTRVYQWVNDAANGIYVDATRTDTDTNDIATGLSNCVTRDGQSPFLANLPAGGFKITGLAAGTVAGDSVNYTQYVAGFANPAFTGTATFVNITVSGVALVPTVSAGDSSTNAASTAFVAATAFSSALPAQTGNSGKVITTDGTTASWTALLKDSVIRWANGADTTKRVAYSLAGLTTATTRTVTMPDKDGTMAMLSDLPLPGSKLLATITATATANLDALTAFSSSYDNYLIIGQGIKPAADDTLLMRIANAGTADSGSNYTNNGNGFAETTTESTATATSVQLSASILAAGKGISFTLEIINANDATNIKAILGKFVHQKTATPGWVAAGINLGYIGAAASGVRFYLNGGGNFAATGKILIYGYSNV